MNTYQCFAFAILCTEKGEIIKILSDEFNIIQDIEHPLFFQEIVDIASKEKANNFIKQIHPEKPASDWQINILVENNIRRLNFNGAMINNEIIIIGIEKKEELEAFTDELTKITSEQANILRTVLKEKAQLSNEKSTENDAMDELSHLNNELTTLQRELTKKNIELENLYAQMKDIAITDRLTKIYNRWGFYKLAEREIERKKRYNSHLSLISFDLDYFKKVNDTYGHSVGDLVLEKIAERGKYQMRTSDIFGRIGGEEFSVLLPETQKRDALLVAKRLQKAIRKTIKFNENSLIITASLGISTFSEENSSLEKLMICADKALYRAKETGRNKICVGCNSKKNK